MSAIPPFYVVLLHHPITNRHGEKVTTAITNLDVHDISRTARTYGARGYFLVTPIEDQHDLVGRILGHWRKEQSQNYHPWRFEALSQTELVRDFDEVLQRIRSAYPGLEPEVVMTDAVKRPETLSYADYRTRWGGDAERPRIIVFGTGWGIHPDFFEQFGQAGVVLDPIYGPQGACLPDGTRAYNHLSVRSAVAIILDRLLGK